MEVAITKTIEQIHGKALANQTMKIREIVKDMRISKYGSMGSILNRYKKPIRKVGTIFAHNWP